MRADWLVIEWFIDSKKKIVYKCLTSISSQLKPHHLSSVTLVISPFKLTQNWFIKARRQTAPRETNHRTITVQGSMPKNTLLPWVQEFYLYIHKNGACWTWHFVCCDVFGMSLKSQDSTVVKMHDIEQTKVFTPNFICYIYFLVCVWCIDDWF